MKTHLLAVMALLAMQIHLRAQTADDYVAWGRAALADTNMVAANSAFAYAVVLNPSHQTANAFYAATRLLALPYQPAVSNFLNRIGVPVVGRDIYNWTAQPPLDRSQKLVVPPGVNADEFTAMARTNLLNEIIGAEANLAKITDIDFTLSLNAGETRGVVVTLDYGDIQLLRAMLAAAECATYTASAYNADAELALLKSVLTNQQTTAQSILMAYPQLMMFKTTNDLGSAKAAFQQAVNRYLIASQFIRNRPAGLIRLFNLAPEQALDEQNFRTTLMDLTNSLAAAVPLQVCTNYTVFLGSYFAGTQELRSFLPTIAGNSFVLGSLPDLSFGGLIQGLPLEMIEGGLARCLGTIPSIAPVFNRPAGSFGFPLHVLPQRGYVLQVSTNLINWDDYSAFAAQASMEQFSDPAAAGYAQRFYRLVDRSDDMPTPGNDNFANRIILSGSLATASGYLSGSTSEANEWNYPWSSTVWFSWTAPSSGEYVITSTGSQSGCFAQICTGGSMASLTLFAYDGQLFSATAGTTYQIEVATWGAMPGAFKLTIGRPPVLALGAPLDGSVFKGPTNISVHLSALAYSGSISNLQVYGDGHLLAKTTGTTLDTVWSNVPPGHHYLEASTEDSSGLSTSTYASLIVKTWNDDFADSIAVAGSSLIVTGANFYATRQAGEPVIQGKAGGSSVWWTWVAPSNGPASVVAWFYDEWGTEYTPLVGVYTGSAVGSMTMVNDCVAPYNGTAGTTNFNATAGVAYRIVVDEQYGSQGHIYLKIVQPQSQTGTLVAPPTSIYNLSGSAGSKMYFYFTIPPLPPGSSGHVSIYGGTGDCDLYVRHGSPPKLDDWDYCPYLDGNNETVTVKNPEAGDWYIMLNGYDDYSGVTLEIY